MGKSDRTLMSGCNSILSEDMYNDGYRNIVNIDFSSIVINNMKRKCQGLVDMDWIVMDITNMSFAPCSFDVVVEEALLHLMLFWWRKRMFGIHRKAPGILWIVF